VEFLPLVLAICSIGWMPCLGRWGSQPLRWVSVQSPYARLTVGTPYLATSSSSASAWRCEVLSASMRTAIRTFSGEGTLQRLGRGPGGVPRRPGSGGVTL
jgi:hypothetical protein